MRLRTFALFFAVALCATVRAEPGFSAINAAIGAELFTDDNLWDDSAEAVATRLGWPVESLTSTDSSYRDYPAESDRLLGARPRSKAFYGEGGLASSVSIVFANKGDAVISAKKVDAASERRERKGQIRDFKRDIQNERKILREALTGLFGDPAADRFGQSRGGESVLRWDWQGHSFLLSSPRDEYVLLRIVPSEVAESGGRSRVADAEIRTRLESRVERRPNGDVVLSDVPMVSQGPKGYCVPATWERVMRYMGVPAEMYVLAMEGQTVAGGGTSLDLISAASKTAIVRAGRRLDTASIKLEAADVSKYIDRGLPLIWRMYSTRDFNAAAGRRVEARRQMTDAAAWNRELGGDRKRAKDFGKDPDSSHVCLIIGYNKATRELCVSDSWGPEFQERWVTEEEARAVSLGSFYVIGL